MPLQQPLDPRALERHFLAFAAKQGISVHRSPIETGLSCMLRFYELERAAGCKIEEDGDMLLFQWGVYDWGGGNEFEVDLARQVVLPEETDDDAIWQLHLTYRYAPTSAHAALRRGDRWCRSPADLASFEAFVWTSSALAAVAAVKPESVVVAFECAG